MMLSVVDAQDLYMSAKAFTELEFSELEKKWHQPALEKLAKVLAVMAKQQGVEPAPPAPIDTGGTYGEGSY